MKKINERQMKKFKDMVDVASHKYGTFAAVKPNQETIKKMNDFLQDNDITKDVDGKDLHITVAFSKAPIPQAKGDEPAFPLSAKFKEWKVFDTQLGTTGKCLVAAVDSPALSAHHKKLLLDYKGSYDFPEYIPHMTVSYSFKGDVPKATPDFNLIFDSYTFKGIEPKYIGKKK